MRRQSDCGGADAQFRLEEDQTQLGIYWNTTGMYLVSVPIVVIHPALADGSGDGMVYTVRRSSLLCSNFHPRIFPEKTEEYDRLEAGKSDKDAESRAGDAGQTGGTLPL